MTFELNLRFPRTNEVIVSFEGEDSGTLPFTDPLTAKDRKDIQWYLEVYGAHSLGDPDDTEAARIAAQLPVWGKALFDAVFGDRAAQRLFNAFQDRRDDVAPADDQRRTTGHPVVAVGVAARFREGGRASVSGTPAHQHSPPHGGGDRRARSVPG